MQINEILSHCDHTLLKPEATWEQIRQACDDGLKYGCASVCIPAAYVRRAAEHVGNRLKICTVIGFPNGYSTTQVKVFETEDAIRNGADEIDMVINLGWVKDALWPQILEELRTVKASCQGRILKVIVETCLLTEEEKIRMCDIVSKSDADFIKTSTGFSTAGATFADVALMKSHMTNGKGIKAAGGIASIADAEKFIELGATRLGTSRIVKIIKNEEASGY